MVMNAGWTGPLQIFCLGPEQTLESPPVALPRDWPIGSRAGISNKIVYFNQDRVFYLHGLPILPSCARNLAD